MLRVLLRCFYFGLAYVTEAIAKFGGSQHMKCFFKASQDLSIEIPICVFEEVHNVKVEHGLTTATPIPAEIRHSVKIMTGGDAVSLHFRDNVNAASFRFFISK